MGIGVGHASVSDGASGAAVASPTAPLSIYPLAPFPMIQQSNVNMVHLALPPDFVIDSQTVPPGPNNYAEFGELGSGNELPQDSLGQHIVELGWYADLAPTAWSANAFQSVGLGSLAFPFVAAPAEPVVQVRCPGAGGGTDIALYSAKGDGVTPGVLVGLGPMPGQYGYFKLVLVPRIPANGTVSAGRIEVWYNNALLYTQSAANAQPDFYGLPYANRIVLAQYLGTLPGAAGYSSFSWLSLRLTPYHSATGV